MRPYETHRAYEARRAFWDRKTVPAGVVLAVVIGLLVWLLATHGAAGRQEGALPGPRSSAVRLSSRTPKQPPPNSAQPPPNSTVAGHAASSQPGVTSSGSAKAGSGCHVPAGGQAVPQYAPQGISWQLYETVALPYSNTAGPMVVDGAVARCYAHDPLGALLAASQLPYRYLISPDWRQVVQLQVMPGKGVQVYVPERSKVSTVGADQPGEFNQLAGFKYVTYTPAVAVIEIASTNSDGDLQAGPVTVDWSDGDWKLQLQPDGSSSPQELPITSLVGFATWSGV